MFIVSGIETVCMYIYTLVIILFLNSRWHRDSLIDIVESIKLSAILELNK